MKESEPVYEAKHKIRDGNGNKLEYQFAKSKKDEICNHSSQCDCMESCYCYCRHDRRDTVLFKTFTEQMYTFHGSRSSTEIKVGSLKALQRRKVKRIRLPETYDLGVGSSALSHQTFSECQSKQYKQSVYDHKRTSSKCVGGILDYNTDCVISQQISPINTMKSGATSPTNPEYKNTRLDYDSKKFDSIETEFDFDKIENKISLNDESVNNFACNISFQAQKPKESKTVNIQKNINVKDLETDYSIHSIVQHVHNLENPTNHNQSKTSFYSTEDKLEKDCIKIFTIKKEVSNGSFDKNIPDPANATVLKRRFEALKSKRRQNIVKNSFKPKLKEKDHDQNYQFITSSPPLIARKSYSQNRKSSPNQLNFATKQNKSKHNFKNERQLQFVTEDNRENQSVRGKFNIWGKSIHFHEQYFNYIFALRKSHDPKKTNKDFKQEKGFLYFLKNKWNGKTNNLNEIKNPETMTEKRNIFDKPSTLNAEVLNNDKSETKIPVCKEGADISKKTWLRKFITNTTESVGKVNIRWNNSRYARINSSTVIGLKNSNKSSNLITSKSITSSDEFRVSYCHCFSKNDVNFKPNIQTYMVPATLKAHPKDLPRIINSQKNSCDKNTENIKQEQEIDTNSGKVLTQEQVQIHLRNTHTLVSSYCLKVNVTKFLTSKFSFGSKRNLTSATDTFKIPENESNISRTKSNKCLEKGDNTTNDTKLKIEVTTLNRPVEKRDVIVQDSKINLPHCDVIGLGIMTKIELKKKPILKMADKRCTQSLQAVKTSSKQCELAETLLKEYYRDLTPLDVDLYPWSFSESNLNNSEKSVTSSVHQDLSSKSYGSYNISSYGFEDSKMFGNSKKFTKTNPFIKLLIRKLKAGKEVRLMPKDSVKVFKKRKIYAHSNKLQWNRGKDKSVSAPCFENSVHKLDDCYKSKELACKKHVTIRDTLAKQNVSERTLLYPQGCTSEKSTMTNLGHISCQKSVEIPKPQPCLIECENKLKAQCIIKGTLNLPMDNQDSLQKKLECSPESPSRKNSLKSSTDKLSLKVSSELLPRQGSDKAPPTQVCLPCPAKLLPSATYSQLLPCSSPLKSPSSTVCSKSSLCQKISPTCVPCSNFLHGPIKLPPNHLICPSLSNLPPSSPNSKQLPYFVNVSSSPKCSFSLATLPPDSSRSESQSCSPSVKPPLNPICSLCATKPSPISPRSKTPPCPLNTKPTITPSFNFLSCSIKSPAGSSLEESQRSPPSFKSPSCLPISKRSTCPAKFRSKLPCLSSLKVPPCQPCTVSPFHPSSIKSPPVSKWSHCPTKLPLGQPHTPSSPCSQSVKLAPHRPIPKWSTKPCPTKLSLGSQLAASPPCSPSLKAPPCTRIPKCLPCSKKSSISPPHVVPPPRPPISKCPIKSQRGGPRVQSHCLSPPSHYPKCSPCPLNLPSSTASCDMIPSSSPPRSNLHTCPQKSPPCSQASKVKSKSKPNCMPSRTVCPTQKNKAPCPNKQILNKKLTKQHSSNASKDSIPAFCPKISSCVPTCQSLSTLPNTLEKMGENNDCCPSASKSSVTVTKVKSKEILQKCCTKFKNTSKEKLSKQCLNTHRPSCEKFITQHHSNNDCSISMDMKGSSKNCSVTHPTTSNENVCKNLGQKSSSTKTIENKNVKVIDEDENTLFERKDYVCEQTSSVLSSDCKKSPTVVVNKIISANPITTIASQSKSSPSLSAFVEIQLKVRIKEKDKTTEINVGKEQCQEKPNIKMKQACCTKSTESENASKAKKDVKIKIIVNNTNTKAQDPKKCSRCHTASKAYCDVGNQAAFSIHRANIVYSSNETSKTYVDKCDSPMELEPSTYLVPNVHSIGTFTSLPKNETIATEITNEFNEICNIEHIPIKIGKDKSTQKILKTDEEIMSVNSSELSREDKNELHTLVIQKHAKRPKNEQHSPQLREILKNIRTDIETDIVTSNELFKNITYPSFKSVYPKTESLTNYYENSTASLLKNSLINQSFNFLIEDSFETNSQEHSTTECICSKFVEKLNSDKNIGCYCSKMKQDCEVNCDLDSSDNDKLIEQKHACTQKSTLTFKLNKTEKEKPTILIEIENFGLHSKPTVNEKEVVILQTERVKKHKKSPKETDFLQSYEAKKAVLAIYAEETISLSGERYVANLPKYLQEKESEVERYYKKLVI